MLRKIRKRELIANECDGFHSGNCLAEKTIFAGNMLFMHMRPVVKLGCETTHDIKIGLWQGF